MDPTLFGPGSFMGKLMGLVGKGQQQGQSGDGSVPVPPQGPVAQQPGFFGRLANAALGQQQPPQPGFGANTAPVEGSPGASVPMPPPRPNPGQDLTTQPMATNQGGQQPLGLLNSDPRARAAGANQIINAFGGIRKPEDLKPAQFAPLPQQQGAGPMQLPPMNLGGM